MAGSLAESTILVVEDNLLNMKLIRALLSLSSCTLLEAGDAESGIKLAVQHQPDLILMDLHLPGMDGLTAAAILKKNPTTLNIPIIAVTSYAMEGDGSQAITAGCAAYITKPIDTRTFVASLTEFLPHSPP